MVEDSAWHETRIYQEVDSLLGIEDMIGLYFPTFTQHLCAVFCGRGLLFIDTEFSRVKTMLKILSFDDSGGIILPCIRRYS